MLPFWKKVVFGVNLPRFFSEEYMAMANMINVSGAVARDARVRLKAPVDVVVERGEHVAVVGVNGSGKNLLVELLLGHYPLREGSVEYDFSPSLTNAVYKNVQFISFRDIYGSAEVDYCYQLRWNVHEQTDIPTVADVLGVDEGVRELLQQFGILYIMNEPVVALSSGELRKLQIVKALSCGPRLLILDNPFIGLDADARTMLTALLSSLAVSGSVQIMLLLSSLADVPQFVDSVIPVEDMRVGKKVARESFVLRESQNKNVDNAHLQQMLLSLPVVQEDTVDEVLSFNNVSVKYGTRTILRNISWKVRSGEVWLLGGANGSGKSTLLSLVCADNLQSYACDITLFGRKRGTGESIWDIKKRIGYVSPEMHRSYLRNLPVKEIVASGLFDTIGLYRRPTEEQIEACRFYMELFGIGHLAEASFLRVSSGEQRLALLARAFVKDPQLLILDEPMHGLDDGNRARVKAIVEAFSRRRGKSVVFVSHYECDAPSTVTHRLVLEKCM